MLEQIPDHAQRAKDRLSEQFKGKVKLETLMDILSKQAQEIEDAIFGVLTGRQLDNAVGVNLDVLGKIVGQPRQGLDDATYRRFIRSRIVSNKSGGVVEDLIAVLLGVLNDEDILIDVDQLPPASVHVTAYGDAIDSELSDFAMGFLLDTIAAGVQVLFEHQIIVDTDELFQCPNADTALDGALSGGETSVPVDDATVFPSNGTIKLSPGLAVEEDVIYTSRSASGFSTAAVVNAHVDGEGVQLVDTTGKGFGDVNDLSVGGELASIKDELQTLRANGQIALLDAAADTTGGTSISSASVTPTDGAVVIAAVLSSSGAITTSIAGASLTWVKETTLAIGSMQLDIFVGTGTPTTDTIDFTFSGSRNSMSYSVFEVLGLDVLAAVEQEDSNTDTVATSIDVTLAALEYANNLIVGFVCHDDHPDGITPNNPWVELSDFGTITDAIRMSVIYEWGNVNPGATFPSVPNAGIVAYELKSKEL